MTLIAFNEQKQTDATKIIILPVIAGARKRQKTKKTNLAV